MEPRRQTPRHTLSSQKISLGTLAASCVLLAEKAVETLTTFNTDALHSSTKPFITPEISIEVAVDLRTETDRLKVWESLVIEHDVIVWDSAHSANDNLRDPSIARITVTLLDLSDELRFLLTEEAIEGMPGWNLEGLKHELESISASNPDLSNSHDFTELDETHAHESFQEKVETFGELNDRLWSFSTALKLRYLLSNGLLPDMPATKFASSQPIKLTPFQEEAQSGIQIEDPSRAIETNDKIRAQPGPPETLYTKRLDGSSVTYLEPPPPYSRHAPKDCNRVKAVIVGDGACGKTCAFISWSVGSFPQEYVPTVFENYRSSIQLPDSNIDEINMPPVEFALFDTAGQEDFDRLRGLSYPETDVAIVSFAIGSPPTLDNVFEKWVPEIRHHLPDVPIVLAGLKSDERESTHVINQLRHTGETVVAHKDALLTARKVRAVAYAECSAMFGSGLQDVFATAAHIGRHHKITKRTKGAAKTEKKCAVM